MTHKAGDEQKVPQPFRKLPISTQTVMAYANCTFDIDNIFEKLPCQDTSEVKNLKKFDGIHGGVYQIKKAGKVRGAPSKKGHFRNQITVKIFIIDKLITVKIFRTGKFHLTGCKEKNHQRETVVHLLNKIRSIHTKNKPTYTLENGDPLNVIIEVVMINVDFNLGFDVDQIALDRLIQLNKCDGFYTVFEPTMNTSVNIKMEYPDPEEKLYEQIIFKGKKVIYTTTNKCPKAALKKTRTHTFLVFSSSKVIQSGRFYDTEMEPAYQKFLDFIQKNQEQIKLKLKEQTFDIGQLKGITC